MFIRPAYPNTCQVRRTTHLIIKVVLKKDIKFEKKSIKKKSNCFVLYTNIDLKLRNKSHVPMHYKIGVTCVYNGHKINTLL